MVEKVKVTLVSNETIIIEVTNKDINKAYSENGINSTLVLGLEPIYESEVE